MAADLLQACRSYLAKAYREQLGFELSSSLSAIKQGRCPAWRYVSPEDLTSEQDPSDSRTAGLLLDPEIGVLCYILPFEHGKQTRAQIKRALALRSQLSAEHRYEGQFTEDSDPNGSWRIAMLWLVTTPDAKQGWVAEMIRVRRDTAFSEELSLDVVQLARTRIERDLDDYGFPRLLLTTREVFQRKRLEEMTSWMSANELVQRALTDFEKRFRTDGERKCAELVARAGQEFQCKVTPSTDRERAPDAPRGIRSIHICNFRNFSDFSLDFGADAVSTRIVHGPNGTGKSSLCEALSLALFRSSFRYMRFSDKTSERDIAARDREREYIEKYLASAHDSSVSPRIALDGDEPVQVRLVHSSETRRSHLAMGGTVLTQEMSLEFAQMSADELGAQVLRGYSDLAEHVEEFAESRANQVDVERKEFLRKFGLTASITRIDTAYAKMARREIDRSLPPLNRSLVEWLESVTAYVPDADTGLTQRWRAWGDDEGRDILAADLAGYHDDRQRMKRQIRNWLEELNELTGSSGESIKTIEARIDPIRNELDRASERIAAWGQWLERRAEGASEALSPETEKLTKELLDLRARQQEIVDRGQSVRGQLDHLKQIEAYVRETWSKQHANECPTCGADHSNRGGIVAVVDSLRSRTATEREALQKDYDQVRAEIEATQKKLAELGSEQSPLTAEEQSELAEWFRWLVPASVPFERWIASESQREELLSAIKTVRQTPPVPERVDAESVADAVAETLFSQCLNAEKIWEAPSNWKPVKEALNKTLADIVNKHLPSTLERLWRELVLNLTAAPWLLLDRPRLNVVPQRGQKKANLLVKERLARYILNQSEIHLLGIGWFFTQYLTRGRFFHACMVMDDPAHELDQTSFRELCRLWETFVRFHRVYERPLKLVVMLHQESRAIDAARATGGILEVLDWDREQSLRADAIRILDDGFHAPQPVRLFEKADV